MFTGFARTVILYAIIIAGIRLMGKRQVGELEPSELVLSLIIADLASVPMQDYGIPLLSGVVQVGFLGVLALIASFLFETPHLPGSGTEWLVVLALALVCSGFGFTLQPVAQSGTTADHAALFCALNPFVAAALGAVCFHEHFGIAGVLGGVLILAGILVSCWPQKTGG